jgi:hypothetical protein
MGARDVAIVMDAHAAELLLGQGYPNRWINRLQLLDRIVQGRPPYRSNGGEPDQVMVARVRFIAGPVTRRAGRC